MSLVYWQEAQNGLRYLVFEHLNQAGLKHGVSSRHGGVSPKPFDSLNLGAKTADRDENVAENRRLFCEAVNVEANRLVTGGQVHGSDIAIVTEKDAMTRIPHVDALVTNCLGLPLMLVYADCVPLLFYDPRRKVVAVSHAGWKGTFLGIAGKTILAMQRHFGSDPADCLAAIGPSIGPDDYEVDTPVMEQILSAWNEAGSFSTATVPGRWQLDLWKWNTVQLQAAGVPNPNIVCSNISTRSHSSDFFSHRASGGVTGRFGALISL